MCIRIIKLPSNRISWAYVSEIILSPFQPYNHDSTYNRACITYYKVHGWYNSTALSNNGLLYVSERTRSLFSFYSSKILKTNFEKRIRTKRTLEVLRSAFIANGVSCRSVFEDRGKDKIHYIQFIFFFLSFINPPKSADSWREDSWFSILHASHS